jgi:hypothetical protein
LQLVCRVAVPECQSRCFRATHATSATQRNTLIHLIPQFGHVARLLAKILNLAIYLGEAGRFARDVFLEARNALLGAMAGSSAVSTVWLRHLQTGPQRIRLARCGLAGPEMGRLRLARGAESVHRVIPLPARFVLPVSWSFSDAEVEKAHELDSHIRDLHG